MHAMRGHYTFMKLGKNWDHLLRDDHRKFSNSRLDINDISTQDDHESQHYSQDTKAQEQGSCDDCENGEFIQLQESSMAKTVYWETQEALLQEILDLYHTYCSNLKDEIGKHIEIATDAMFCDCVGPKSDGCAKRLRRLLVDLLCSQGFEATLRTSTWQRTQTIPGGRHEYIEVVVRTQGRKRITLLVEIGFQDEFQMAKACDEYRKLIHQLPGTFIGKNEHLNGLIRVMCDAAKRSTAEKKMHMGPWRKRSFMQMKWSASNQRRITNNSEQQHTGRVLPFPQRTTAVRVA